MKKLEKLYIKKGKKFNRLIALEDARVCKNRILCKCNCGNKKKILASNIKNGQTKSCGCLNKEKTMEINKNNKYGEKHGLSNHALYKIWGRMKNRCYNTNYLKYKYWGGRGIKVCHTWMIDFMNFYNWAVENGWKEGLTLERIKNWWFYCPENCRFATRGEQNRNTRSNHIIEAFGEKKILVEWSEDERCLVNHKCLEQRINRYKWSPEKAITTPPKRKKQCVEDGLCLGD